jgi:hypothetical protein
LSRKSSPGNRRTRKSVTVKAAWIGGGCVVAAAIITAVLPTMFHGNSSGQNSSGASSASSVSPVAPKTPPLRVLSENPIDVTGNWSFPGRFALPDNAPNQLNTTAITDYLNAHGGYPSRLNIQLVVQNTRSYPIRITDMQVVKSCHPPLQGTLFLNPAQGSEASIEIGFNLDLANPEAKKTYALGPLITASNPDYFAQYTVSINSGAQQVFDIRTITDQYSCTFRYRVTVLDGTHEVHQLIGDGSQPFRISAIAGFAQYSILYVGGDAGIPGDAERYVRVNPKTFAYLSSSQADAEVGDWGRHRDRRPCG